MNHFRDALAGSSALVRGPALNPHRYTRDNYVTYDRATMDSAGAFLIGELERLDPMVHEPLVSVTWQRDIDLRTDVQMGDTSTSYTVSSFGAAGGAAPAGIAWASPNNTAIPRVTVDIGKVVSPFDLWDMEVAYTVAELESARITGRPIDVQQLAGLNLKHQMDADQLVYVGDAAIGTTGLLNSSKVVNVSNVANGANSTPQFATKTPNEILADVNELLISVWAASGYKAPPSKLLMAPNPFGYIVTTMVSEAGTQSILNFLQTNNILTAQTGQPLDIKPVKWLDKGVRPGATTDRMAAYSQNQDYVRFPMVPLQPLAPQYDGIWVKVPYYGRFGVVETVYPETVGYRDGIG
ncbi:hypothetical protein GCM10019059_32290 [Camelimonas fluminis]|uniref:DUF2184 domain-containing protein n=1 Tax=Camelimonas fluminis TaxID=1576911 RepID=A0ABV7UIR3_9HYPH|nr:DUF2184 domain-containing protein [Camelimonas fluminis]GHE70051.1 hypothetical protein GCM10019059_32290 [Camelimonas fluminis]